MAPEAVSYREDVEQARRRFAEFRQAHAVRSRLPEELWATAAKLARRDGITATANSLESYRLLKDYVLKGACFAEVEANRFRGERTGRRKLELRPRTNVRYPCPHPMGGQRRTGSCLRPRSGTVYH